MAIRIALFRNPFTRGPSLIPRVVHRNTVTFDQLLERMASDTALETTDLRAALTRLLEALVEFLISGAKVHTPFGTFAAYVSGTSTENGDRPDISRKGVTIRFAADRDLTNRVRENIEIQVEERMPDRVPVIELLSCVDNPECGGEFHAGEIVSITGARLAFDIEQEDEGVFLVSEDAEEEYRATVYSRHGTRIIDCKIPDAPAGTYGVEVRSRMGRETLSNGTYANTITVAEG